VQADKHRREVDFDVGDRVYLSLKGLKQDRPSPKLADKAAGPFEIIRKVGHAFELQLPAGFDIHPVFTPEKLRLARKKSSEPLTGQIDPAPPVQIGEHDEWEVDRVLDSRLHYRKLQYKIKWKGHDIDNTWYPARNLRNAPYKIQEFHEEYPNKPGPPMRLQQWVNCALQDDYPEDHVDDGKPVQRD
jgi:hypothetical protein